MALVKNRGVGVGECGVSLAGKHRRQLTELSSRLIIHFN
jgi:hypothetical protein